MQKLLQKNDLKTIKMSDISIAYPDLKNSGATKSDIIGNWLIDWIKQGLNSKKLVPNTLLPSKAEFAYAFGVSVGTIQNALRYIEDRGYVESKQRIGTIIKDKNSQVFKKLTSKREIAIEKIKKYIISNNLKPNDSLPSSRVLAEITNCSANTTRLALEYLCKEKYLKHKKTNETGWFIQSTDFSVDEESKNETLVKKTENDLKEYITQNLKIGDRMPSHEELTKKMQVSIKTVHDALQNLVNAGILLTRRGRYGTSVIKMPDQSADETSIFAPAQDAAFYYYEKTQNTIRKMISENYEIGSKLPSISELSTKLDLSHNTIRKALQNLAKEGYLAFSRGRYGGTFVIDIPEEQSFKWIAVNPKYAQLYKTP